MDDKHNLNEEINKVFKRSPRTGLTLLHRNYSQDLANTCYCGARGGLTADECQDAYSELQESLVRRVVHYESDPESRELPIDIVAYSFKAARLRGANYLDRKLSTQERNRRVARDNATNVNHLTSFEIADLTHFVMQGLDGREQYVVDQWFFAQLRHERQPSERELSRRTGFSRPKVKAIIRIARYKLAEQIACEKQTT